MRYNPEDGRRQRSEMRSERFAGRRRSSFASQCHVVILLNSSDIAELAHRLQGVVMGRVGL